MKLAEKIKLATLAFWHFERRHMVGAIECKDADVMTVNNSMFLTETEIKISIADMRREVRSKRYKHQKMRDNLAVPFAAEAHYFYFAVPVELKRKALEVIAELYPYAGLLVFNEVKFALHEANLYYTPSIVLVKRSKRFDRSKVSEKELREIAYVTTNTIMRYGMRLIDYEGYQRDRLC